MPVRFRCTHCRRLQAISSRKVGQMVACAVCGEQTLVVAVDETGSSGQAATQASGDATKAKHSAAGRPRRSTRPASPSAAQDAGDLARAAPSKAAEPTRAAARQAAAQQQPVADDEPTFVTRKASTEFEEMDLTPMVDVTFLLLIFFMITASFSLQKTLPFPPPSPDEKGTQQTLQTLEDFEEDSVIVEIDENNVIYVEDSPVTDPAALVDALRDAKKSELVLTAHPDALHETVVKVIDAANEVGMQKIRLAKLAAFDF